MYKPLFILLFTLYNLYAPNTHSHFQAHPNFLNFVTDSLVHQTFGSRNGAAMAMGENSCKVRVGIKVGTGLSTMNFNKGYPKPSIAIETIWKVNLNGGGTVEVPLSRKVILQQEYQFSYITGEARGRGSSYGLGYVSLPVLLKYDLYTRLGVFIGPQFDLLLVAKELYQGKSTNIIHEAEERSFWLVVGFNYRLSHKVSIDTRYLHGINHINIKQGAFSNEFMLESFQLSLLFYPI